jgi:hypothetical protein
MPVCSRHDIEDAEDKLIRDLMVKQIRHRIDEDSTGLSPSEGQIESVGPQLEIKSLLIRMPRYPTEPFGKPECVAMIATRANLSAAGSRIPSGISPFDA